jgi:Class III cytochrome C family
VTKGDVPFSHKKHSEDYVKAYAKIYPNGCGDCHHDDKGKPIAGLKADSKVQACIECHKKCGEAPKGKDAPKLDKKQKLDYHSEAFHDNCIGCHKEFNKEFKPKKAPVTCNDCHPKKS